jgi:hypothetical protein
MRQRFLAMQQPGEVFVPPAPVAGTAPQSTNATLALTIAKAEARHAEISVSVSAIEDTIAKLDVSFSIASGANQPAALKAAETQELKNLLFVIKTQPAVPRQRPATEIQEAPTKLKSFVDKLKTYADAFFLKLAESAGTAIGTTIGKIIPYGALCYLLIDQINDLSDKLADWLNVISAFFPGG